MIQFLNQKKTLNKSLKNKKLIKYIQKSNGRNNQGKITVRHRGGGHKQLIRSISFHRKKNHKGTVLGFYYDPKRSANLAGILNKETNTFFYILAPENLKIQSIIETAPTAPLNIGNTLPLKNIPIGSIIHNICLKKESGAQLIRSAGTFAQLIQKVNNRYATLRLKSGELRLVSLECYATLGVVSNSKHHHKNLQKAGRSRWLNRRPKVRGVAKNPVDHPHGGGEGKTSGGRPSVSPQGRITKGKPTRKKKNLFILQKRK